MVAMGIPAFVEELFSGKKRMIHKFFEEEQSWSLGRYDVTGFRRGMMTGFSLCTFSLSSRILVQTRGLPATPSENLILHRVLAGAPHPHLPLGNI